VLTLWHTFLFLGLGFFPLLFFYLSKKVASAAFSCKKLRHMNIFVMLHDFSISYGLSVVCPCGPSAILHSLIVFLLSS
jgi:hypothetical protein